MADITIIPAQGGPEAVVNVLGTGFAPSSPLTVEFGDISVDFSEATSDSAGDVSGSFAVPHQPAGPGIDYTVTLTDSAANSATATFTMCLPNPADGISTVPDPILAQTGVNAGSFGTGLNFVRAYIHHDGAHWVAWEDPSALESNTTFPPPPNHTLNLTMITDDGEVIVNYELDTGYKWSFNRTDVSFPAATTTQARTWFTGWSKPITDLKLASDGTTIWVALVTSETVIYPHLSTDDGRDGFPSQLEQFVSLEDMTFDFTTFATTSSVGYSRYRHTTDGTLGLYEPDFPVSDGGDHGIGYWSPPRVVMFAGGAGGFTRIGTMDATFCPGSTDGYGNANSGGGRPNFQQGSPRNSFSSGLSLAASDAQPGICHLVWSEGGDYGPVGRGSGSTPDVWDGGPSSRGYRIGYSTWDAAGKLDETDLFDQIVDRTGWYFDYDLGLGDGAEHIGYSWPDTLVATGVHALRNEHGSPVLLLAFPQVIQNPPDVSSIADGGGPAGPDPAGRPWLDNAVVYSEPTLRMYDLSTGSPVLQQQITPDQMPTEAETDFLYSLGGLTTLPPLAPDTMTAGLIGYANSDGFGLGGSAVDRGFGVSALYQDPLLDGGTPVYLVILPWVRAATRTSGPYGIYRVPADGSAAFDFLDGLRQVEYSIVGWFPGPTFGGFDFVSDSRNVWCPHATYLTLDNHTYHGVQLDRICENAWLPYTLIPTAAPDSYAPLPWYTFTTVGAITIQDGPFGGIYHDPVADTISYAAVPQGDGTTDLFSIAVLQIDRDGASCACEARGLHAFLRFGHSR